MGFDGFITLKEFKDPSNGYLVNDTCVFGAEVFVHRENVAGKGECLLMTAGPDTCNHTWKIDKFSELDEESHFSKVFTVVVMIGTNYVEAQLRIMDQVGSEHVENRRESCSSGLMAQVRIGVGKILSFNILRDQSKGYLVKDVCIIEAHLLLIGAIDEKLGQKSG
ncbi:uncharacterized protein LOC122077986 [Macadamia integrifolia]|uniref:uncharacterized protein LOC122077986 n=1 Tax=Macadamia integrifolia TaxID=60698 RepID=UPI001C4FC45F|nr:uncharacterized protein LOC122077986 [Macadamia integrifolia]